MSSTCSQWSCLLIDCKVSCRENTEKKPRVRSGWNFNWWCLWLSVTPQSLVCIDAMYCYKEIVETCNSDFLYIEFVFYLFSCFGLINLSFFFFWVPAFPELLLLENFLYPCWWVSTDVFVISHFLLSWCLTISICSTFRVLCFAVIVFSYIYIWYIL